MNIELPESSPWYALGLSLATALWIGLRRAFAWREAQELLRTEFVSHVKQEDADRKELKELIVTGQERMHTDMALHDERVSAMARDLNQLIGKFDQHQKDE